MIKNSTYVVKAMSLFILLSLIVTFSKAQTASSPNLKFVSPVLFSGNAGEKHAIYKFSDVIEGIDAYIKIEKLVNGAYLVNIDESSFGYPDAWQPKVGGPGTVGRSYIKWSIKFKTTAGDDYSFPTMDLSAIDIDGDNGKVREFIEVNGESNYDLPLITLMGVNTIEGDNEDGDDYNPYNLEALGPIANRTDIDTTAVDVRINFHFKDKSMVKIITGSQVDDNGFNGGVAAERLNSLYFKNISLAIVSAGPLPITYRSFDVVSSKSAVILYWITDMEGLNDHFEVERSYDQKDFKTVSLVLGALSVNGSAGQYSYKDAAAELAEHAVIYYRLKQIDLDGKFTYSTVKMVRTVNSPKPFIQVSPNPYVETLNINFVSEEKGTAEVRLLNLSGQVVVNKKTSITKGYNNIQLSGLSSSSSGIYMADILVNGNVIDRQKLVKQ